MADITENLGLNYDLDGSEVDYYTKLNENTLKLDAYAPLSVLEQIALGSLPAMPTDGDKYIVDGQDIYIRQSGTWSITPLVAGQIFYDQDEINWYVYDGTSIEILNNWTSSEIISLVNSTVLYNTDDLTGATDIAVSDGYTNDPAQLTIELMSLSNVVINSVDDIVEVSFDLDFANDADTYRAIVGIQFDSDTPIVLRKNYKTFQMSASIKFKASQLGLTPQTYSTVKLVSRSNGGSFDVQAKDNIHFPHFSVSVEDKS